MSDEHKSLSQSLNAPCKYCGDGRWSDPYFSEGAGGTWWHKNEAGDITMPCAKLWMTKLVPAATLAEKPAERPALVDAKGHDADWHRVQEVEADAMGYEGAAEFHNREAEKLERAAERPQLSAEQVREQCASLLESYASEPCPWIPEMPAYEIAKRMRSGQVTRSAPIVRSEAGKWQAIEKDLHEKSAALLTGEAAKGSDWTEHASHVKPSPSCHLCPPAAPPVIQAEPQPECVEFGYCPLHKVVHYEY